MTDLAILVPVLRRPHRVAPLLESIAAGTGAAYRVVFICDPDDQAEQDAVRAAGLQPMIVHGNYARKINLAAAAAPEALVFLGADDLDFHPGWLPAALAHMKGKIRVVGTNDLGNRRVMAGDHATHCLVDRDYAATGTIDEPGKLLHEGYLHEFVDDEFVQTAQARGVFAAALDSHVEHLHPNWGKAPTDELYDRQQTRMHQGRRLYRRRQHLWT